MVLETSSDIDLLKQKKAHELHRKMLLLQNKPPQQPQEPKEAKMDSGKIVRGILAGRGVEVLETARRYYPQEVMVLEGRIAEAVRAGRLKGPVSGEELYSFLRSLGLNFSMDIKIRVAEKGKLKTLEEKLREKKY